MDICIDFDGTCVTHEFPAVGEDIGAEVLLRELVAKGNRLILFTMRSNRMEAHDPGDDTIQDLTGQFLDDAINWFKDRDIPLYGIQTNPTQVNWTTSPKAYGQLYIDDAALGCPLIHNDEICDRPFVDWEKVKEILIKNKIIMEA